MTIERRDVGEVVVLSLAGRLDAVGGSTLQAGVHAAVARGARRLVLDCASMTHVSSTGLRALLLCARECSESGVRLAIATLQPACRVVMDMSGFSSVMDCHETSDAAISAVA